MKRFFIAAISAVALLVSATPASADYNRAGLSYDNTAYMFNKDMGGKDGNFSANGFGLNYIHGFRVSKTLPMYVEAGLNLNFDFSSKDLTDGDDDFFDYKQKFQNINFQIPVNYTYHFNVGHGITVTPYVGLNFKINAVSRIKYTSDDMDEDDNDNEWSNLFSKEDMGSKDATWNVFQMGWHIGVGAEFRKLYLGLQYGTDFIPAYGYKEDDINARVNTGNFRLMPGYTF